VIVSIIFNGIFGGMNFNSFDVFSNQPASFQIKKRESYV